MNFISAKEASHFFQSIAHMFYEIDNCKLGFYLKYPNGSYSKRLLGLYDSKRKNFFKEMDYIYFDYQELNAKLYNDYHRIINLECDMTVCPYAKSNKDVKLWGLPKRVFDMRQEGKTEKEIAELLHQWGLPYKAITALLYTGDNILGDWEQPAKRLLKGKTDKI